MEQKKYKRNAVEFGSINSPEARKKCSDFMKQQWKTNRELWLKRNNKNLFNKGKDFRREGTQFKDGHETSDKTIQALKESRAKQIFPLVDSSIEIKMQNMLKKLNIEFITHKHMPIGNEIDIIRTRELRDKGFKVCRLWESEINTIQSGEFQQLLLKLNDGVRIW